MLGRLFYWPAICIVSIVCSFGFVGGNAFFTDPGCLNFACWAICARVSSKKGHSLCMFRGTGTSKRRHQVSRIKWCVTLIIDRLPKNWRGSKTRGVTFGVPFKR